MQSSRFPSQAFPRESDRSLSSDLFPNASAFAPIFAGRQAPPAPSNASTFPTAAFFSEFASPLAEAIKRLTTPTAEVIFDRFGFATLDNFARRFAGGDVPPETLLFADERGFRRLLIAPTSTFRLLLDAALGFDVATLCADETLWSDFNADAQTPLTPIEKEAFVNDAVRFASLFPTAVLSSPLTGVSFCPTLDRAALELDDALFYWERRFVRLANRFFPWTLVFPARFLAPLADAAFPRDFSEAPARFAVPPTSSFSSFQSPLAQNLTSSEKSARPFPSLTSRSSDESSISTRPFQSDAARLPVSAANLTPAAENAFEFAVVVERGEMTTESWKRLKPGDVLTTNVPANALFLGLVNETPRFLCRPGLFRGAAAVQIKSRADDDRE